MKSASLLLSGAICLNLVNTNVWAATANVMNPDSSTQTSTIVKTQQDEEIPTAKLDPATAALIVEVGFPLASALFNKVSSWLTIHKDKEQKATQDTPVISNYTVNWRAELEGLARNHCYAYIDRKVAANKQKYLELAQQFGGVCDILTPNVQTASSLFPAYTPNYLEDKATKPLNIGIIQGYGTNYQGLQLKIEMLDNKNNVIATRPVTQGFKSNERFRLKVTPTFTGLLQIKHIGSDDTKNNLFPKAPIEFVQINAGETMILPANPNNYYYFDDQSGEEKLIIQFVDYQGLQGNFSNKVIYRHDDQNSTYLMQEISKMQFPFIMQTISMQHH